jgi:hypothetical protein
LTPGLPVGIDCLAGLQLEGGEPSLQQDVTVCRWEIELDGVSPAAVAEGVAAGLAAPALVITRSRKGQDVTDDVRPAILAMTACGAAVVVDVATQPRGLRPGELLDACFPGMEAVRVLRTHQWIERDGARREPIPVDATSLPHALRACA